MTYSIKSSSIAAVLTGALAVAASAHGLAQEPAEPAKSTAAQSAAVKSTFGSSDARARAVLSGMAEFLARTERFSVKVHAGYDTVQPSGKKIEFAESRTV